MEIIYLSDSVGIKKISETPTEGQFEIEGLYGGYGLTIGNALRRVLLSSLPGAAITQYKIKGVSHEFSTIPNIKEDAVELGLNLKKIRFRAHTDEPQILTIRVKGERVVTAKDIELPTLTISNNQPYGEQLNSGTSDQAPSMFVELEIQRVENG